MHMLEFLDIHNKSGLEAPLMGGFGERNIVRQFCMSEPPPLPPAPHIKCSAKAFHFFLLHYLVDQCWHYTPPGDSCGVNDGSLSFPFEDRGDRLQNRGDRLHDRGDRLRNKGDRLHNRGDSIQNSDAFEVNFDSFQVEDLCWGEQG